MSGNRDSFGDIEDDEEYHYSDDEAEYQYSDIDDPVSQHGRSLAPGTGASESSMNTRIGSNSNSSNCTVNNPLGNEEYRVIETTELQREQNELIEEVSGIWDLEKSAAGILLRYFSWNKEKLLEQYCIDPEETRTKAGLQFYGNRNLSLSPDSMIDCLICCETYKGNEVFGLGCQHLFCKHCWGPYLSLKIAEGPVCVDTTCPAQGCNEIIPDEVFKQLTSAEDYKKFSKFLLRSYVDYNKSVKWCPSPGCDKAISGNDGCLIQMVKCSCGCRFCMKCGEDAHHPATCGHVQQWQEKCRNESETANWILANTKKCPKCSVRIEKNQGCNHMTCRHCKHDFCWICLGLWKDHGTNTGGFYKCNRYDPSNVNMESDVERAKAELDRYLHYYQRFANHAEAEKFASRMREETERRMVELQESSSQSWIDVQFLKTANEQLIDCRRVLKYTYVMAYYLPNGKEKNLFEYLQENLEKNTEHLTGLSEMPLDKMNRTEIINYTRVTERFLQNLLDGVRDGLTSEPSVPDFVMSQ